jgi:hypothetical protein
VDDELKGAEDDNYLALICCQKHKPHPAPTYIPDRVWYCDKDKWVDDELKGAEALAYRLDLDVYGTKCGYFSNVENCRPY